MKRVRRVSCSSLVAALLLTACQMSNEPVKDIADSPSAASTAAASTDPTRFCDATDALISNMQQFANDQSTTFTAESAEQVELVIGDIETARGVAPTDEIAGALSDLQQALEGLLATQSAEEEIDFEESVRRYIEARVSALSLNAIECDD